MKQLLCMVDLYKCGDCKHFVANKDNAKGYCEVKHTYADKVKDRSKGSYACRAFAEKGVIL